MKNLTKEFWDWFSQHQEKIHQNVENPEFQETFFEELLARLRQINEHLGFEFSPIFEDGTRQMCITANGIKSAFPTVMELIEQSPELENWQFIAFRQRKPYDEFSTLKIDDYELSYDDIYFRYSPDEEGLDIELNVRNYDEKMHNGVFLLMDALVGEYNVATYISSVDFVPLNEDNIDELYNISLLPDLVDIFAPTPEELNAWAEELKKIPLENQKWEDWQELADAAFGEDIAIYRLSLQEQINLWYGDTQAALASDDPDFIAPPTTLLLALQNRLALSYTQDDPDKAQTLLKQLLSDSQALQTQHPDEEWLLYWVSISRDLAYALPDEVEIIVEQLQKAIPQPASAFDHRAIKILSERIRSYACYAKGNLKEAIKHGMAGFSCFHDSPYSLDPTRDGRLDLIQWLEEAGDTEQQVQVMDTLLYDDSTPEDMRYDILMKAWEMIQNGVQHPLLALYIGAGGYEGHDEQLSLFDDFHYAARELRDADPDQPDGVTWYRRYVELAKQWAKGNTQHEGLVDIAEAMFLQQTTEEEYQNDTHNRNVLELLERGCRNAPTFVSPTAIVVLWIYRLRVYGRKALSMPFVPAGNAAWSYNSGWNFLSDHAEMELSEYFEDLDISGEEAANLAMKYYADGIARYEHFWATGEGAWRDGWAYIYAIMCHNYGILLRIKDNDYETSLDVELKGLNISPFSEAYESAIINYYELGDFENYIKTHETLWHFVQKYGDADYDLSAYQQYIVRALSTLDRKEELGIWYERLKSWWATIDEDGQDYYIDYYASLTATLGRWSDVAPEEALEELQNYTDELLDYMEVSDTDNGNIFAYAGIVYSNNGQYQEAILWYDRAIAIETNEDSLATFQEWREEDAQALSNEETPEEEDDNPEDDPDNQEQNKKSWWKRW